jgi:phage repressor protein C with HTH and peptisase S24 domain
MEVMWILQQLEKTGQTQRSLADGINMTPSQLNKIIKGRQRLKSDEADRIRRFFGTKIADDIRRIELDEDMPDNTGLVPVYDVAASAGYGAIVGYEPIVYSLAFPNDYLRRIANNSSPKDLAIIGVKGDSMEPTIQDDDIVLIDTSKRNLNFDGLFVLAYDDVLQVKRVGRSRKQGHVQIISDNTIFPAYEAPISEISPIGKVLWYGRRV